jgi:hypothetical protein
MDIMTILTDYIAPLVYGYVAYLISLFTLSLSGSPLLEKIAVWGFNLVPNILSKIIGKHLLDRMVIKIKSTEPDVTIYMNRAYPFLLFEFNIDSKAEIDLKPIELTAYVYHQSAFMGKIHWNQNEKRKSEKGLVDPGIARHYELDEVNDIKAQGEGKIKLHFNPPLEIFKVNSDTWHLEIFIMFSTKLGNITKLFTHDLHVKNNQLEEVKRKFSL